MLRAWLVRFAEGAGGADLLGKVHIYVNDTCSLVGDFIMNFLGHFPLYIGLSSDDVNLIGGFFTLFQTQLLELFPLARTHALIIICRHVIDFRPVNMFIFQVVQTLFYHRPQLGLDGFEGRLCLLSDWYAILLVQVDIIRMKVVRLF